MLFVLLSSGGCSGEGVFLCFRTPQKNLTPLKIVGVTGDSGLRPKTRPNPSSINCIEPVQRHCKRDRTSVYNDLQAVARHPSQYLMSGCEKCAHDMFLGACLVNYLVIVALPVKSASATCLPVSLASCKLARCNVLQELPRAKLHQQPMHCGEPVENRGLPSAFETRVQKPRRRRRSLTISKICQESVCTPWWWEARPCIKDSFPTSRLT